MKTILVGWLAIISTISVWVWPKPGGAQEIGEQPQEAETPKTEPTVEQAAAASDGRPVALTARVVLKVVHPKEVQHKLLDELKKLGGYPSAVTEDSLTLRVPPESLNGFVDMACENGWPLDKKLERQDLGQAVAQLEGSISAKREILAKLQGFFDKADVETTVQTERKMTSLVEQLESLQGELRYLRDRARLAVVVFDFRSRRQGRLEYQRSSFDWINTANLNYFLEEF